MPIHFAAARRTLSAFTVPARRARLAGQAANDNDAQTQDVMLRDALRHFAEHGLRAAQVARDNALQAHASDDQISYLHWLEICRTLDRRMAVALSARIDLLR